MLEGLTSPGPSGSDRRVTPTPEQWRARAEYDEQGGFLITPAVSEGNLPGAEDALREQGLDPAEWRVTSVRKGRWQKYDGDWLESMRVNVVPVVTVATPDFDLEQLVAEVSKWRPGKAQRVTAGNGSYVHVGADKQLGKKSGSGGTDQTVRRILAGTEASVDRLARLRKYGLSLGTVVLPEVGDHVEGNVSQNGRLQGQAASDLGQTEQVRLARRLLLAQVKAFAPLVDRIVVPVVNGNHDEVTRQVAADPADGWNVEIASAVQDVCAENPELARVEFRFPASGHQTLAVDIDGVMLGLFHGHQFGRDVVKYLDGQSGGKTALGGSDIFLSGHYHHFKALDYSDRLWLQAPTVDPGSEWFRDPTGQNSKPAVLTFVMGGDYDPREHLGILPL
jgi:predicted phosphodiesterase